MYLAKIFDIIKRGDERTSTAKKNIFYSFFIKGFSILISLLLIPITIRYLNTTEYGIWLTLNSILLWINTLDVGLGNGLRNKLAESLAIKDFLKAKAYVSTCYVVILLLMLGVFCVFQTMNIFLDWHAILNINKDLVPNLDSIVSISFGLFCLTFVLKLIGNILLALHRAAVENFLIMAGQLLSLIIIYGLSFFSNGNLLTVAVIYSATPAFVFALSYPFVFSGNYKQISPSIRCYKRIYVKSLVSLGSQFFIVQIASLVIFSTANLLIANLFGPKMVTTYNVAFRYFSVITMLFSIILPPMWSATTDAYVKGDLEWIRKGRKKLNLLIVYSFIALGVMTLVSKFVFRVWVGNLVTVPINLAIIIAISIFVLVASMSYSSLINGMGKLRVQMINTVFSAVIFLPLTYFMGHRLGINGVILSIIIVNLSGLLLNYFQLNLLITNKATGIWAK